MKKKWKNLAHRRLDLGAEAEVEWSCLGRWVLCFWWVKILGAGGEERSDGAGGAGGGGGGEGDGWDLGKKGLKSSCNSWVELQLEGWNGSWREKKWFFIWLLVRSLPKEKGTTGLLEEEEEEEEEEEAGTMVAAEGAAE